MDGDEDDCGVVGVELSVVVEEVRIGKKGKSCVPSIQGGVVGGGLGRIWAGEGEEEEEYDDDDVGGAVLGK